MDRPAYPHLCQLLPAVELLEEFLRRTQVSPEEISSSARWIEEHRLEVTGAALAVCAYYAGRVIPLSSSPEPALEDLIEHGALEAPPGSSTAAALRAVGDAREALSAPARVDTAGRREWFRTRRGGDYLAILDAGLLLRGDLHGIARELWGEPAPADRLADELAYWQLLHSDFLSRTQPDPEDGRPPLSAEELDEGLRLMLVAAPGTARDLLATEALLLHSRAAASKSAPRSTGGGPPPLKFEGDPAAVAAAQKIMFG